MNVKAVRAKSVFRWDAGAKMFRLLRVMWERGEYGPGPKDWLYSVKLSLAVELKLADFWVGAFWKWDRDERTVWVCFLPCVPIRIHYIRSYGGKHE